MRRPKFVRRNLESRVAMLEQKLAEIEEKKRLENCTCRTLVLVSHKTLEKFRAAMNQTCPAHGFRELMIVRVVDVEPAHDLNSAARKVEHPEVDQLLAEYKRRLAESRSGAGKE
jgi:hypothetical protein